MKKEKKKEKKKKKKYDDNKSFLDITHFAEHLKKHKCIIGKNCW